MAAKAPEANAPQPRLMGRGPGGPGQQLAAPIVRAKDTRGVVRRLWGYLGRQRAALVVTAFIVAATSGLNLLGPYLLGVAIDRYMRPGGAAGLARIALLMLAVHATSSLLTWLQTYIMAGASQRTVRDIRRDLFERLQDLPLRFFDRKAHGDLMSRLTNDVDNVSVVLTDSVPQIVSGVLSLVGVAIVMFTLNPILAAVSITTVAATTLIMNRWMASHAREGFRRQQAALGTLNGFIEETVSGQRVVKAYGREPMARERFDEANATLRTASTRAQIFAGFVGPLMNFINNLGLAIIAGIGGYMSLRGVATVGTIAGFIGYSRQFGRPLNEIANLYNSIQSAVAGAERVFEVIDETPEIDEGTAEIDGPIRGDVVFENVTFGYDPASPVLRDVSLHAAPGETIALVGPTGAGKTTIVNLLTRFYEIDRGEIRIDGCDVRDLRKADLRRRLGIVLQDTFLFADTVRENIRYGRLDATDEEVIAAARTANADTFIHRLPHGYDTVLSEGAHNLSQGQRQLLAIARAILADPGILILDEATSSVDTRTEKHIQEAMLRLMAGRTSFVIAHRLNTIRDADRILVIDGGRIVEQGTHAELMAREGAYHRLHTTQFGGR